MTEASTTTKKAVIQVTKDSLPVCCPPKDQEHWNQHPRVYLSLKEGVVTACPYCGNRFELIQE